ncbi:MAG: MFS transporter [Oscillospiraceae bacterium]|nr:MFS transporter [Oscillospiraceae bacterium]
MGLQQMGEKEAKRSLYAACMLRIYLSLNNLGFSVSLPVITKQYDALEWFAIILVVGSTASTIVSAFAGRFTTMLGRRKTIMISTIGTAATSLFCAFSGSLGLFVIGYFFMNIFYGVASTMPVAIVVDSTDPEERPRYMSLYSVMNNTGSLLGPLLGGLITDLFGFTYTPIYPLPLAAVSLFLLMRFYRQPAGAKHEPFDFAGSALIIGGVGSLIVFLNTAGKQLAWTSPVLWGLGAMFLLCLVVFLRQGRRCPYAIIPLKLFSIPSFSLANILIPLILPQMTLSSSFTLLLVQSGMGRSAASSATYAIPKTLAIICMSLFFGRWISHHHSWQKKFVVLGGLFIGGMELLMGLASGMESFPTLLYGFNFLLGVGEAMYYMTLYPLYQRDLDAQQLPTGISAQFLIAMLSLSLTSTAYGAILSAMGNDIMAAYPVMCFVTLIPTGIYLLVASLCLRSSGEDHVPMGVFLPGRGKTAGETPGQR